MIRNHKPIVVLPMEKKGTVEVVLPMEKKGEIERGKDFLSRNKNILSLILEYLDSKSLCRVSQCSWYLREEGKRDKYWKKVFFREKKKPSLVPGFERWKLEGGERSEKEVKEKIGEGKRWKFFFQLANEYDYVYPAILKAESHDIIFLPEGVYDMREEMKAGVASNFVTLVKLSFHLSLNSQLFQ